MIDRLDVLAEVLRDRLAAPLPGLAAQLTMSPPYRGDPRALVEAAERARKAAVLALLFPGSDGPALVLTERTASLRHHAGQIALPGGRLDDGETPEQAALREAEEEVGVPRDAPDVLGRLTDLYIPPSRFTVTPCVAVMPERPTLFPAEAEVARVIELPLATLLDPAVRAESPWTAPSGETVTMPFYALPEGRLWGATAMMLAELVAILREAAC